MHHRTASLIQTSLILFFVMIIGACQRATPAKSPTMTSPSVPSQEISPHTPIETSSQPVPSATNTVIASSTGQPYPLPTKPTVIQETQLPYPQPTGQITVSTTTPSATQIPQPSQTKTIIPPPPTETATEVPPYPGPGDSPTPNPNPTQPYPGPGDTPTPNPNPTEPYPGPEITNTPLPTQSSQNTSTSPPYPGSATSTPNTTRTPVRTETSTGTQSGGILPSITTTQVMGTPGSTPTELPPRPPLSPPPAGSSVTIWHSWGVAETDILQSVIRSFQRLYPSVTFNLLFVPLDDLFSTYQEAAYLGQGPSLLLGPSSWGKDLFDESLIADLDPFIPPNYLTNINSAALSSGKYHNVLISLPLSLHGLVMFRNTSLISTAPSSFDELITLSHQVTHGGVVGSYLERGSYFSAPNIIGLGGRVMDESGNPTFSDPVGLEWLDLLAAYDKAGAVTFNTNRDLEMFKKGRVGIIIDGTWNISVLAQSIGSDNLAIDPWPTFGTGHMAGWLESDSVFLNANTTGNDRFAALSFMGYLLDPNVQMRLAEVGHIPSVLITQPRDRLIRQAMIAFLDGVPFPIMTDKSVLSVYWNELDVAIRSVFERRVDPASALKIANENILQQLKDIRTAP